MSEAQNTSVTFSHVLGVSEINKSEFGRGVRVRFVEISDYSDTSLRYRPRTRKKETRKTMTIMMALKVSYRQSRRICTRRTVRGMLHSYCSTVCTWFKVKTFWKFDWLESTHPSIDRCWWETSATAQLSVPSVDAEKRCLRSNITRGGISRERQLHTAW